MKKSISYWSFTGKNAVEAMTLAKDAGFDGIELTLDSEGDINPATTEATLLQLKQTAQEIGIALPSVACSLYWTYSFTSDDHEERQKALDTAKTQIRFASILGADTVLVVPGSVSVEFVPERPVVSYDVAYDRALEAMGQLAPVAKEYGVHVGVENVWNRFLLSPLEMRTFLDTINSPYVGSYFDVGNVVAFGHPEQWIQILGSRIRKVHFKDYRRNPGGLGSFVDLLSGDVNWPAVQQAFANIGYDGWATAEMIPAYAYAPDQCIYNTSNAMTRILGGTF